MKLDDFLMRLWMDGDDEIYLWIVKFLCMTLEKLPLLKWNDACLWMDKQPVYGCINARFRMDKLHYKSKFYEMPWGIVRCSDMLRKMLI